MNQELIEEKKQKSALLLDDNLMSAVRVEGQLERAGFLVHTKGVLPSSGETPDLILINLGSRSLNGVAKIETCRAQFPDSKILGFCGHTEIEIRKAAKAARIGRIFTNEEAMLELAQLLKNGCE